MSEERSLTASQKSMVDLWEEHTAYEFEAQSIEMTGSESARKMLDPASVPSDLLIERARRGKVEE